MNSKDDSAAARFLASMPMTQEMWHDGTGYDLDALRQVPADLRMGVEEVLIRHSPRCDATGRTY